MSRTAKRKPKGPTAKAHLLPPGDQIRAGARCRWPHRPNAPCRKLAAGVAQTSHDLPTLAGACPDALRQAVDRGLNIALPQPRTRA